MTPDELRFLARSEAMRNLWDHNHARGYELLPSPDVVRDALKHMGLPGDQEGIGWLKGLHPKDRGDIHDPFDFEPYDD
jgi:hypothetical protein